MRTLPVFLLVVSFAHGSHASGPDFAKEVRPILAKHCFKCHGPDEKNRKGDLRLDVREGAIESVVVPGKPGESELVARILAHEKSKVMPPPSTKTTLTAEQKDILKRWISAGAEYQQHWAFVPPKHLALPAVKQKDWVRNGIDAFILNRLEQEGLTPSPEADRTTLIRRVSLDLIGLPPTPEEVDAFLADKSADAYEKLVDRLLASPRYGERWARRWLDIARYADTNGYEKDRPRTIWPYRDWVINAFNRDIPFSDFVIHQLAGDLLPGAGPQEKVATGFHRNTQINQEGGIDLEQFRVEAIIDRVNTTGSVFLGLTVGCAQCHDHKYDPIAQREYYEMFAFFNNCDEPTLSLPTDAESKLLARLKKEQAAIQKTLKDLDTASPARQKAWEASLSYPIKATFPANVREFIEKPDYQRTAKEKLVVTNFYRSTEQIPLMLSGLAQLGRFDGFQGIDGGKHVNVVTYKAALEKKLEDIKKREPKSVTTMVLQEKAAPRETFVHIRGDFLRKGKKVAPSVPAVFPSIKTPPTKSNLNRLDFARWVVSQDNPLTARVFVNRLWQQYFGRGIVETENDFGTQGHPPSHPELLDWLACEFMAPTEKTPTGATAPTWSIKHMHRLIVASAAYRQSSKITPEYAKKDPQNRLLGRQNRLRLEAEIVRDVALASSGLLNHKIGGPSVFPPQPEGVFAFTQVKRDWKADTGPDRFRRGMYTYFWRSAPHPALMAFDAPDGVNSCTRRIRSNTPLQALTLLNDRGFYEYAQGLAVRILNEAKGSDEDKVNRAFQLCLARSPSEKERARIVKLVAELKTDLAADLNEARKIAPASAPGSIPEAAAWTLVSRVLLNLDEFITRE